MSGTDELLAAIRAGEAARARRMLEAEPELAGTRDASGVSALLLARYRGQLDLVQALLERREKELDVFEAAALGRVERLEGLLAREPRAAQTFSPDGFTPLHLAAFFAQASCARSLLERGARVEVESKNAARVRPLHSAIAGGSLELAALLLSHGADVAARQEGGFTPLHGAASAGRADLAEALLGRGADPESLDAEGRKPSDHARAKNHAAVLQLLEARARRA